MKKLLLRQIILTLIVCFAVSAYAQEYYDATNTPRQWFYNNLEGATAGTNAATFFQNGFSDNSTTPSIKLSAGTLTGGLTKSFSTVGGSALGFVRWNFLKNQAAGAAQSLNSAPWEWEFDYKNTTGSYTFNPDSTLSTSGNGSAGMVAGKDSWRYWLITNADPSNTSVGLYVTQAAGKLTVIYKSGAAWNAHATYATVPMPNNNHTYQIRCIRSVNGYWQFYVYDKDTGLTSSTVTSSPDGININIAALNTYNLTYLEATSAAAGRFEWDNFNFYQVKIDYVPIAGSANGISDPVYPGMGPVIITGWNVNVRGDVGIGRFVFKYSGDITKIFNTSATLYEKKTLPLSFTGANSLKPYTLQNNGSSTQVDLSSLSLRYYSSGNTDGTTGNVTNFFVGTTALTTFTSGFPTSVTYSVSPTNSDNFLQFFGSVFPYNSSSSSSTTPAVTVSPIAPPTVTGTTTLCGTNTTTLTASGTSGATYNWYTASTGGVLLQSSTSATYTPFVAGTTTYYVSATVGSNTSSRTAVTVTVNPKISTPLTGAMISYPFNNTFEDISGNDNDATSYGSTSPSATTDRYGNANGAFTFNGTTQYLSSSITNYNPQIFSISLWFRTTSTSGGKLIGFVQSATAGQSGQFDRHIYMNASGNLYFGVYLNGTKTIVSPRSYNDGLWHRVVVTVSASGGTMYVDGSSVGTNNTITGGEPHNGYWRIGGDNLQNWPDATGYFFNGDLDDVGIYYRALSASEITNSNDLNLIGNTSAYCRNNSITLTAPSINTATYSWVDNANPSNTYTGNPGIFTNAGSGTYSLTLTINGCSSTATITPSTNVYTWTGAYGNSDLTRAENWTHTSAGEVSLVAPTFDGTESIVIPSSATIFPVLTNAKSVYSLTLASGATITLNNNTLNVACNITDNNTTSDGIIYGTTGNNNTINWNGSVLNQAFYGSNTTKPAKLYNMVLNNTNASTGTLTISSGKIDIYNLLTVTKGKLTTSATAELTLKGSTSAALTYAQVAPIGSGASIQGKIYYEVLFQGGAGMRNYRSMGAPIYNTTPYSSGNGFFDLSVLINSFIITGYDGINNGFDASSNNGATIRTYNPATDNYTFVTNLNTASDIPSGTGFYMYFRGNKTPAGTVSAIDPYGSKTNKTLGAGGNTYATPENVLFKYYGIPNQGTVSLTTLPNTTSAANRYYYFVANPYAATFDLTTFYAAYSSYLSSTMRIWNPNGSYAGYDCSTGVVINGGKRYVVPGEGFFIQNLNTSGTPKAITATESMKSVTNNANAVRLLSTSPVNQQIELPITKLQLYKNSIISDEIAVVLKANAADSLDYQDATHMNGDFMNLTTITPDNKYLAIDKRPFTGSKKIIPLFVNVAVDSIYTFKNTMNNTAMSNYKVTLYDSLLNNSVDIVHNDYKFNITRSNAATYGGKRFKLIIEAKPAPVTYFAFEGKLTDTKKGLLTWQTNIYREGTTYQLQRSQDNATFNDVSTARTGVEGTPKNTFEILDNDIQAGKNYYRLVQTDVFNNKTISNTVMLNVSAEVGPVDIKNGFKLYPNPVSTTLSVIGDKTYGKVTMRVYDSMSNVLSVKAFSEMIAFQPISENVSQLKLGVYFVELRDSNNNILTTLKFIKQ